VKTLIISANYIVSVHDVL